MRNDDEDDYICQICGMEITNHDWGSGLLKAFKENDSDPPAIVEDAEDLKAQSKWLIDARLLCDPDDEFGQLLPPFQYNNMEYYPIDNMENDEMENNEVENPDIHNIRPRSQASEIEVHVAETWGGFQFERAAPNHAPKSGWNVKVSMDYANFYTFDERVYAVVHAVCLEIAKKVFESSQVAHVRDMRGLFTCLRWREAISFKCGNYWRLLPQVNYMLADHGYYVPYYNSLGRKCRGMDWPGPYSSPRANLFYSLGMTPLNIKDLTGCLLRNLQPCRSRVSFTAESSKLAEGLARMPTEIIEAIFSHMGRDLPRSSSRVVAQKFWKEQLKSACRGRGLLPWLWDIDVTLVDAKDAEPCPGGTDFEWDWELLVRHLTRGVDYGVRPGLPEDIYPNPTEANPTWKTACTGYHTDLVHVPAGLHNRRRIWQLLEEMFVGDALPWPTKRHRSQYSVRKECVPLCWDKSGNILSSPIWIPSINFFWSDNPDRYIKRAFFRKLGGEVYTFRGKSWLQYWQRQSEESVSYEAIAAETDNSGTRPATVEEIYAVLRPLGYPV